MVCEGCPLFYTSPAHLVELSSMQQTFIGQLGLPDSFATARTGSLTSQSGYSTEALIVHVVIICIAFTYDSVL